MNEKRDTNYFIAFANERKEKILKSHTYIDQIGNSCKYTKPCKLKGTRIEQLEDHAIKIGKGQDFMRVQYILIKTLSRHSQRAQTNKYIHQGQQG